MLEDVRGRFCMFVFVEVEAGMLLERAARLLA